MGPNGTCACACGYTNTYCEDYVQGGLTLVGASGYAKLDLSVQPLQVGFFEENESSNIQNDLLSAFPIIVSQ